MQFILRLTPKPALVRVSNFLLWLRYRAEERLRQLCSRADPTVLPAILSGNNKPLERSILEQEEPWQNEELPACHIPGMLTESDRKYYLFATQTYAGIGEIVEIGCWLGCSTFHILHGLQKNQRYNAQKLYVFDDFIWRSAWG